MFRQFSDNIASVKENIFQVQAEHLLLHSFIPWLGIYCLSCGLSTTR